MEGRLVRVGYTNTGCIELEDIAKLNEAYPGSDFNAYPIYLEGDEPYDPYFMMVVDGQLNKGMSDKLFWSIKACQLLSSDINEDGEPDDVTVTYSKEDSLDELINEYSDDIKEWAKHLETIEVSWIPKYTDTAIKVYAKHVRFMVQGDPNVYAIIYI